MGRCTLACLAAALAVVVLLLLGGAPRADAQLAPPGGDGGGQPCFGETEPETVPKLPGPPVRYGVVPGVEAGQTAIPSQPTVPEDPRKTHRALDLLRPRTAGFVVRLNRLFWKDRDAGIRRFERLVERYASRGYVIEIQLRYHPDEQQEGDIAAWTEYVREVVRRLGAHPRVRLLQVTNEVTITFSPDSSDGAFEGAKAALVQGVITAQDEKRRRGLDHLKIGFNWFYRLDPATENEFWTYLRDEGGPRFVAAVDWVGLDAYPGTFFPPVEAPGEEYDGMVNGMSQLRCFLDIPGIPGSVPMVITENGWPTSATRSYDRQAIATEAMIRAVHDFRGTYNVSDYAWHNLRDANSSDPKQEQQYGLMRDDYTPKPAFWVYCGLVARLSTSGGETACDRADPRLRLKLTYSRGTTRGGRTCARGAVRARVVGGDAGDLAAARFSAADRRVGRDDDSPFEARIPRAALARGGVTAVGADTTMAAGRETVLTAPVRACARSSGRGAPARPSLTG